MIVKNVSLRKLIRFRYFIRKASCFVSVVIKEIEVPSSLDDCMSVAPRNCYKKRCYLSIFLTNNLTPKSFN